MDPVMPVQVKRTAKKPQRSAKGGTKAGNRSTGFAAEERAAMKERAKELKSAADKADSGGERRAR